MSTLSELVTHYKMLKDRLAIWEVIREVLISDYLPRDERGANKRIITEAIFSHLANGSTVDFETIGDILKEIEDGPISALTKEIANIETKNLTIS